MHVNIFTSHKYVSYTFSVSSFLILPCAVIKIIAHSMSLVFFYYINTYTYIKTYIYIHSQQSVVHKKPIKESYYARFNFRFSGTINCQSWKVLYLKFTVVLTCIHFIHISTHIQHFILSISIDSIQLLSFYTFKNINKIPFLW